MNIQIILKNKFAIASFNPEINLIRFQFLEHSTYMTEQEYKEMFLDYANTLAELYIKKEDKDAFVYLSDIRATEFIVVPELQEWIDKEVIPTLLPFSKKLAILLPADLFSSIATQQAVEEPNFAKITTQYFDDEDTAIEWLLT